MDWITSRIRSGTRERSKSRQHKPTPMPASQDSYLSLQLPSGELNSSVPAPEISGSLSRTSSNAIFHTSNTNLDPTHNPLDSEANSISRSLENENRSLRKNLWDVQAEDSRNKKKIEYLVKRLEESRNDLKLHHLSEERKAKEWKKEKEELISSDNEFQTWKKDRYKLEGLDQTRLLVVKEQIQHLVYEENIMVLEQKLAHAGDEHDRLRKQVQSLEENLSNLNLRFGSSQQELSESQEEEESLRDQVLDLKIDRDNLQKELSRSQSELQVHIQGSKAFEDQRTQMSGRIFELEKIIYKSEEIHHDSLRDHKAEVKEHIATIVSLEEHAEIQALVHSRSIEQINSLLQFRSMVYQLAMSAMKTLNNSQYARNLESRMEKELDGNHVSSCVRKDWSGRGSHSEYKRDERIPLNEGRFLGCGVNGEVHEVICQDVRLALKKIVHRHRFLASEKREIDVLKKLKHRHIIELVGTYVQSPILGLLLAPVAQCDLSLALEFLNNKLQRSTEQHINNALLDRLRDHDLSVDMLEAIVGENGYLLAPRFGCLASAMAYLHANNIRHKDIKPSNILLSSSGTWITDFGMAKDFTTDLTSTSESRERGTLKYCAPEVATYLDSGRSADMFSLGCVFLEIIVVLEGHRLEDLAALCTKKNRSYEANLDRIEEWLDLCKSTDHHGTNLMIQEIRQMVSADRDMRPTAEAVALRIASIDTYTKAKSWLKFCSQCCDPWYERRRIEHEKELAELDQKQREMKEFVMKINDLLESKPVDFQFDITKEDASEEKPEEISSSAYLSLRPAAENGQQVA